jgi:hypothetical protein
MSDQSQITVGLEKISKAFAKVGLFNKAIETAHKINNEWCQQRVLVSVVNYMAKQGYFIDALSLAESFGKNSSGSIAYALIGLHQSHSGEKNLAAHSFQQALQCELYSSSYYIIADALSKSGGFPERKAIFYVLLNLFQKKIQKKSICEKEDILSLAYIGRCAAILGLNSAALKAYLDSAKSLNSVSQHYDKQTEALAGTLAAYNASPFSDQSWFDCLRNLNLPQATLSTLCELDHEVRLDGGQGEREGWLSPLVVQSGNPTLQLSRWRSFMTICPENSDVNYSIIGMFIAELVKSEDMDRVHQISQRCPQLGIQQFLN